MRDDEGVDECRQREQERQHREHDPDWVQPAEIRRQVPRFHRACISLRVACCADVCVYASASRSGLLVEPEDDGAEHADEDERCARGAIGSVSLIYDDVRGLGEEPKLGG